MLNQLFNARAWLTEDDALRTQSFMAPATQTTPLISPDEVDQALYLRCGCSSCAKAAVERDPDAPQATGLTDEHGDTIATASSIEVDGAHIIASIDALGDQDFFAVELVEGQWYEIGQYLTVGGPSLIPLADAYIELYDSAGNLITSADGGGPNTPSGLDALLTYQADYTGTYYINARAFDQDGTNGTTGDHVGDYELFVDTSTESPTTYRPFYDTDSPLHSLDWGSQIDRTSRNPDGDNGTRPNPLAPDGNGPIITNNYGIEGKNVVTYYFAKQGDFFVDEEVGGIATMIQAQDMQQWEMDAFRQALDLYEQVADVIYLEVDNRNEADFKFITYQGTPGVGASLLGRMSPPNEANEGQMEINAGDVRWTEEGVQQGGFYFPTLVHELGHGHGLSHPHDNGGRSSVMPGADGGTGGLGGGFGDWGLSQQVFTIMSYNDGWNEGAPYSARPAGHGGPRSGGITGTEVDHFGWQGTLAALDIAVIQDKYGVNEEWARGDDVYEIKDFNGAGNFYSTIWDGGGVDEIRYSGAADASIDLRAASLRYEEGGGGWVSYALGLWGGFTIANGVTIENASGGAGDDALTGNDVANMLSGDAGADVLIGRHGDDTLGGGLGNDRLIGGAGADRLFGGDGLDFADYAGSAGAVTVKLWAGTGERAAAAGDTLTGVEGLVGSRFDDVLHGDNGDNFVRGGVGADVMLGLGGFDVLSYAGSKQGVFVKLWAGEGYTGDAAGDVFEGFEGVVGSSYRDRLIGSTGDDQIEGGRGNDLLTGLAGADTFVFEGASGADRILDFEAGPGGGDVLTLDRAIFSSFANVMLHTTDDGLGNTVIAKDGISIRLDGVLKADLSIDDIRFTGPAAASEALVLPGQKEEPQGLDPLVLPVGLEHKTAPDEAPVICPPVETATPADLHRPDLEMSDFMGRDPHRVRPYIQDYDWIV